MPPRRATIGTALMVAAGLLITACSASSASPDAPAGQVVAVCGRKNAPPLFGTLEALGKERCLHRIEKAIQKL